MKYVAKDFKTTACYADTGLNIKTPINTGAIAVTMKVSGQPPINVTCLDVNKVKLNGTPNDGAQGLSNI